jgi:hypothetical protein
MAEEKRIEQMKDTVRFLKDALNGSVHEYAFIKLHKEEIPYVSADIDLLVKKSSLAEICRSLSRHGALKGSNGLLKRAVSRADEVHFVKKGLLEVDIYTSLAWFGLDAVSEEFLWRKSVTKDLFGINIEIPEADAEALVLAGHALFWHGTLTLLDVIQIYTLTNSLGDPRRALGEAARFGWDKPLYGVLSMVREAYERLFFQDEIQTFPLKIPISLVILSYLGLVISALRKGPIARSGVAASRMAIHLVWMIVSRKLVERYKEI